MRPKPTIKTKLVALIGYPLDHSLMAHQQHDLYEAFGIDAVFLPFEIKDGGIEDFLQAAKTLGIRIAAITMPHKTKILPYLDDAEENCKIFNCANYFIEDDNGKRHGYALDGYGLCDAIEAKGYKLKDREVLIIGAGGVASVTSYELAKRGVKRLTLINDPYDMAKDLCKKLQEVTDMEVTALPQTKENLDKAASQSTIIINTTPLGMEGVDADYNYLGFLEKAPKDAFVAEVVYNPFQTSFLKKAEECGLAYINGMNMQAAQMRKFVDLAFGVDIGDKGGDIVIKAMTEGLAAQKK